VGDVAVRDGAVPVGNPLKPMTYPAEAPRGPIVAITGRHAMSGGEIMIQALKTYGIATVVGTRTWGGNSALT
jgi:tricorn protease